jgi:hypothetical protein
MKLDFDENEFYSLLSSNNVVEVIQHFYTLEYND